MGNKRSAVIGIAFILVTLLNVCLARAEIRVYDANNKYVGILLDRMSDAMTIMNVFIPPFGIATLIKDMEGNGALFSASMMTMIYYESSDCSGTPYVPTYSFDSPPYPSINALGGKYFVLDARSPQKSFVPKSTWDGAGIVTGNCTSSPGSIAANHAPMLEIPKESLPFPFTFPLHFDYLSGDINGNGKIGLEEAINALQTAAGLRNQ